MNGAPYSRSRVIAQVDANGAVLTSSYDISIHAHYFQRESNNRLSILESDDYLKALAEGNLAISGLKRGKECEENSRRDMLFHPACFK